MEQPPDHHQFPDMEQEYRIVKWENYNVAFIQPKYQCCMQLITFWRSKAFSGDKAHLYKGSWIKTWNVYSYI